MKIATTPMVEVGPADRSTPADACRPKAISVLGRRRA